MPPSEQDGRKVAMSFHRQTTAFRIGSLVRQRISYGSAPAGATARRQWQLSLFSAPKRPDCLQLKLSKILDKKKRPLWSFQRLGAALESGPSSDDRDVGS